MLDLVVIAGIVLIVYAALSPLESLRWFSRSGELDVTRSVTELLGELPDGPHSRQPRSYLVYLSGIGTLDGTANSRKELAMLDRVAAQLPDAVVIADIFPYSVENRGLLTGERRRTTLWQRLQRLRRKHPSLPVHMLINLRNVFQMFVSADHRYGPAYNLGVARQIWTSIAAAGYTPETGSRVYLIGYSGGGQIALGAAWHLGLAGVDVSVISLGGMLSDDPGLDQVTHLWHLYGSNDRLQRLGRWLFPGRWPTAALSSWNKAKASGRITQVELPGMAHDGRGDYFDFREDDLGAVNAQRTADEIVRAVRS